MASSLVSQDNVLNQNEKMVNGKKVEKNVTGERKPGKIDKPASFVPEDNKNFEKEKYGESKTVMTDALLKKLTRQGIKPENFMFESDTVRRERLRNKIPISKKAQEKFDAGHTKPLQQQLEDRYKKRDSKPENLSKSYFNERQTEPNNARRPDLDNVKRVVSKAASSDGRRNKPHTISKLALQQDRPDIPLQQKEQGDASRVGKFLKNIDIHREDPGDYQRGRPKNAEKPVFRKTPSRIVPNHRPSPIEKQKPVVQEKASKPPMIQKLKEKKSGTGSMKQSKCAYCNEKGHIFKNCETRYLDKELEDELAKLKLNPDYIKNGDKNRIKANHEQQQDKMRKENLKTREEESRMSNQSTSTKITNGVHKDRKILTDLNAREPSPVSNPINFEMDSLNDSQFRQNLRKQVEMESRPMAESLINMSKRLNDRKAEKENRKIAKPAKQPTKPLRKSQRIQDRLSIQEPQVPHPNPQPNPSVPTNPRLSNQIREHFSRGGASSWEEKSQNSSRVHRGGHGLERNPEPKRVENFQITSVMNHNGARTNRMVPQKPKKRKSLRRAVLATGEVVTVTYSEPDSEPLSQELSETHSSDNETLKAMNKKRPTYRAAAPVWTHKNKKQVYNQYVNVRQEVESSDEENPNNGPVNNKKGPKKLRKRFGDQYSCVTEASGGPEEGPGDGGPSSSSSDEDGDDVAMKYENIRLRKKLEREQMRRAASKVGDRDLIFKLIDSLDKKELSQSQGPTNSSNNSARGHEAGDPCRYKVMTSIELNPPKPVFHPKYDLLSFFIETVEPYLIRKASQLNRNEIIQTIALAFAGTPAIRKRVVNILERSFPDEALTTADRQGGYKEAVKALQGGQGELEIRAKTPEETFLDHYEYMVMFHKITKPHTSEDDIAREVIEILRNTTTLWPAHDSLMLRQFWGSNELSRINCGMSEALDKKSTDRVMEQFNKDHGRPSKTENSGKKPAVTLYNHEPQRGQPPVKTEKKFSAPHSKFTDSRAQNVTPTAADGAQIGETAAKYLHPKTRTPICIKCHGLGKFDNGLTHYIEKCKETFCLYCKSPDHNMDDPCPAPGFKPRSQYDRERRRSQSRDNRENQPNHSQRGLSIKEYQAVQNEDVKCVVCLGKGKNGMCSDAGNCECCYLCRLAGKEDKVWMTHSARQHDSVMTGGETLMNNLSLCNIGADTGPDAGPVLI